MQLPRFVGLVDLGVATVIIATIVLPAREMYAGPAHKGDEAQSFALALAEARTIAHPEDGMAVDDLSRRLGDLAFKDWAVEVGLRGSEKMKDSPTRWRALLATSVAYVDKLDVIPALDYANRALTACGEAQTSCPSWEELRMRIYQQHLDAGVQSGIDPHVDPRGFREAGQHNLRGARLKSSEREQGSATTPAPAPTPTP